MWMEDLIAPHRDPRAALESVFQGVGKLASSPECLGCAFVGAAAEFPSSTTLATRRRWATSARWWTGSVTWPRPRESGIHRGSPNSCSW